MPSNLHAGDVDVVSAKDGADRAALELDQRRGVVLDIGGVAFVVSQESKLLDEVRVKAIEDARRKAEIYAKAANIRLGAPVSISEEGGSGDRPMPVRAQFKAGATSTPIAPGEETLNVSVTVAYEILK